MSGNGHELERLVDGAKGGLEVQMVSGTLDGLSPAIDTALYRLAQESVTNARRHARSASRVTVRVVGSPERVQLTVDDDGAPGTPVGNGSGYGLVGMRERPSLLGGTFRVGPAAGRRWHVEAMMPRDGTQR